MGLEDKMATLCPNFNCVLEFGMTLKKLLRKGNPVL